MTPEIVLIIALFLVTVVQLLNVERSVAAIERLDVR